MLSIGSDGIAGNNMLAIGVAGISVPASASEAIIDGTITHEDTAEITISDTAEITIEDRP